MNEKELQALIEQGEGFHIEFKESVSTSLAKELVAFANAKGGKVLIGVNDDGEIMQKKISNKDLSSIQSIARDCDPSINIEIFKVENTPSVVVVEVAAGENKPYRCTAGFYMKEGASSVKRTTAEIGEMFADAEWYSFDDSLCLKADFDTYFSKTALENYLADCNTNQILSDSDTLHNLGVLEYIEGQPVLNNTGVLFFTDNPTLFIPQSLIQCVRYAGVEKVDIEDQLDLDDNLINNFRNAFSFLRRSLRVKFDIAEGSPQRTESWEVPYVALREALVNAIAHRDYHKRGTHIQVEIFDDRVSITNFGGLPKGLDKSDLGKRSVHRNPNIVNLLHRAKLIEKLGTGLTRIKKELEKAKLPEAEFDISENWFSIIFKRVGDGSVSDKGVDIAVDDRASTDSHLTVRDYLILEVCQEPRTRKEVLEHFIGISSRKKNYDTNMAHLVDAGLIAMTNPDTPTDPNQKYFTTQEGLKALEATRSDKDYGTAD